MAVDGDTAICKNCDKEIGFIETSIDNFWAHPETRLAFCNPNKNMFTAEDWAEPSELH